MRLTKQAITELKPGNRDRFLWDESLPGFGIRIKTSGIKTFILQYRNAHGRSKRFTLGRYGQITLDQAKREATKLKGAIGFGQDPTESRKQAREGDTVRDLAERYLADHCDGRCKPKTRESYRWMLDIYILPQLGSRQIKDISTSEIIRIHQSLRQKPYVANRFLSLLQAMLNKAEHWGILPLQTNPAKSVKPFTEKKRERFLSQDEFKRLYESIDELDRFGVIGTFQAGAIRLLTLTGCRLNEILSLRWSCVDFENRRLLIEEHKTDNRGAKAIPLNSSALGILAALSRSENNAWVFVGKDGIGHIVNLQKPWNRVRRHAGLEGVRLHDLRHSFASAAISAGISLPVIGAMLGHKSVQSTARYAHLAQDPVRDASELVGAAISSNFRQA
jgi:integrase